MENKTAMMDLIDWAHGQGEYLNDVSSILSILKKANELLEKEKNLIKVAFVEGVQNKGRKYNDSEEYYTQNYKK